MEKQDEIPIELVFPITDEARALIGRLDAELMARYPGSSVHRADLLTFEPPSGALALARVEGRAVACGGLRGIQPGIGEIKRMYVDAAFRRRGISRRLLHFLEEQAVRAGYHTLRLETGDQQPEALALYESEGYRRIAAYGEYLGDPHSICFEKRFPAACPVCRDIPDYASESYKSNEHVSGEIPAAASKLVAVGYTHGRDEKGWPFPEIKRCPDCGAYYRHKHTYEYLVDGSEDDYEIWRLPWNEGRRLAAIVISEVKKEQEAFEKEHRPHLEPLVKTQDLETQGRWLDHLVGRAIIYHRDLRFALPVLVDTLKRHAHVDPCPVCKHGLKGLEHQARRGEEARQGLRELLTGAKLLPRDEAVATFIRRLVAE